MACGFNADPAPDDLLRLVINDQVVEMVDTFVYLGSLLSSSGRFSAEVDRRLAGASRSFGALQCVFRNRDISVNTKRLLYSSCVLSTLLYGAECWAILRHDEARLDRFHHKCLRSILGVSRRSQQLQHISNADLRDRWGDPGLVSDMLRKRRLQWLGHVARMGEDRLPKQLLLGWLPQVQPAHGPRLRWKDRVADDLGKLGVAQWYQVGQERSEWRSITRMLPSAPTTLPGVSCEVCGRSFKSKAGLSRHKCMAASKNNQVLVSAESV